MLVLSGNLIAGIIHHSLDAGMGVCRAWLCRASRMLLSRYGKLDRQNTEDPPLQPEDFELELTTAEPRATGQQTAKAAAALLVQSDTGFLVPTASQREAILVAFVLEGFVVYGKAFDIVKLSRPIDLENSSTIRQNIDAVTLFEIKSTSKDAVTPTFERYFFSLSTAELLVAQNLGDRYRFAFVNIKTRAYIELTLREVFARAKGIYPTWSIQF